MNVYALPGYQTPRIALVLNVRKSHDSQWILLAWPLPHSVLSLTLRLLLVFSGHVNVRKLETRLTLEFSH